MATVAIIEDDENIRELVCYALKSGGFTAYEYESGAEFFGSSVAELPDIILLDIMLPGDDGLFILKKLKLSEKHKLIPVIMLTAKGSELDKVKGLDTGADDYVTKPFSVMELMSRINAVLRRAIKIEGKELSYGGIAIDDDKHSVTVDGKPVTLTLKEYDLLRYMIANPRIVLSRSKIIETVWGYDFQGESRTIDMHIKTLRQKLGPLGEHIKTIRGIGYKIGE